MEENIFDWDKVSLFINGITISYIPNQIKLNIPVPDEPRFEASTFSFNIKMAHGEYRKLRQYLKNVPMAKRFRLPRKLKKKLNNIKTNKDEKESIIQPTVSYSQVE